MDWRYVERFSDDLEYLTSVISDGISTELVSTHPPWTGSAWPSMYTGVPPDYHGVFDFFDYTDCYPSAAETISRSDVKAPALWEYLTERDCRSIVLNLPVTHPAEAIDGVLVPGYLAPEDEPGHPHGIRDEISAAIGSQYSIYSEYETSSDTERKIDGYIDLIDQRAAAAEYLIETTEWDLSIVQFQKTDAVFHNSDAVNHFKRVYMAADRALGRIQAACSDDTNLIVCSDHGIGPVDGYQIHLNQILEDLGYLTSTDAVNSAVTTFKPVSETDSETNRLVSGGISRIADIASKTGVSPSNVHSIADRVGIADSLARIAPDGVRNAFQKGVSWEESKAFCRRQTEQGIRINLRGRDPAGVVPPDEYEDVREAIIRELSALRTPDGNPAFEFVCRREEVYDGPFASDACDILFRTKGMNHAISPKLYGVRFHPLECHDHKRNGIFIADGPDVNTEATIDSLSLTDVAPIAISLLGSPVPERMTGTVPDQLHARESISRARYDVSVEDSSYEQNQQDVRKRLADLGYL